MSKIFLILGVLCLSLNLASSQRVVCYYTNWAQYRPAPVAFTADNIDANLCNVIIYSFGTIVNNNLATNEWNDDTMIGKIVALKQKNPNLKVTMAVGGGSFGTAKFSDLVTNPGSRVQFINSVVQFLRSKNLDGLGRFYVNVIPFITLEPNFDGTPFMLFIQKNLVQEK